MESIFEKYIKFVSKRVDEDDDEDIVMYNKVEVVKSLTEQGPYAGEKYARVDLNRVMGDVVFRLKTGGCKLVVLYGNKPPKYAGEHKNGPENVVVDEQTYLPPDTRVKNRTPPK